MLFPVKRIRYWWFNFFTRKDRRGWGFYGDESEFFNMKGDNYNHNVKINSAVQMTVNQAYYPDRGSYYQRFGINDRVRKVNRLNDRCVNKRICLINARQ